MQENVDTDRIDSRVFEIKLDDRWVRFRTVLHISKVYGCAYGVEDYFNAIANIGARMVKVIEEKAGYAPEQPMNVDESAVFPGEIQGVVAMGYRAITEELNAWRAKATA
jgi:hypothetical protein